MEFVAVGDVLDLNERLEEGLGVILHDLDKHPTSLSFCSWTELRLIMLLNLFSASWKNSDLNSYCYCKYTFSLVF